MPTTGMSHLRCRLPLDHYYYCVGHDATMLVDRWGDVLVYIGAAGVAVMSAGGAKTRSSKRAPKTQSKRHRTRIK